MHYAALSGNPDQLDRALNQLKIPFDSSADKMNLLHYAILSDEPKQFRKVLDLEIENNKSLDPSFGKGRNIFHLAAFVGDLEIMKMTMELMDDFSTTDQYGFNALDYAIANQKDRAEAFLRTLKVLVPADNLHEFYFAGVTYNNVTQDNNNVVQMRK